MAYSTGDMDRADALRAAMASLAAGWRRAVALLGGIPPANASPYR
jgi:hypothetical protein